MKEKQLIDIGLVVVETELSAINALKTRIDDSFSRACKLLLACRGRVVVTGMGKSGHIGGKIAATLASTGTPAFFVHPGEASHGDLGMITREDVVLALSNSGETSEILTILPMIKRFSIPLVAMTGNSRSTLATSATVNLDTSVEKEACPLGLAPTASTTVALVMGDAIAVALLEARGFTEEDFALSHPGGALGRRLLLRVDDIMHRGDAIPRISKTAKMRQALLEMSQKGLGMTAIVDDNDRVLGIFTDGDLRRSLDRNLDIHTTAIADVMTRGGVTAEAGMLAAEALKLMEDHKISALLICDQHQKLVGALNVHDLLRAGVV